MAAVKKPATTQELPNKEAALFRTVVVRRRAAIGRGSPPTLATPPRGGCMRACSVAALSPRRRAEMLRDEAVQEGAEGRGWRAEEVPGAWGDASDEGPHAELPEPQGGGIQAGSRGPEARPEKPRVLARVRVRQSAPAALQNPFRRPRR